MNTIIKYLSPTEFKKFKQSLGLLYDFDATEKFGLNIKIGDKNYIVICNHPELDKHEKQIILWHEKGHASGIIDEEDADRYALKHIDKEAQENLIDQWEYRHGHSYS